MAKKRRNFDDPQYHADHPVPITRRQLVAQGFKTGCVTALSGGVLSLFADPRAALAALSNDLADPTLQNNCGISPGAGKIPFICFDLAGGANIAGSNVLIGKEGGQLDFLSTEGYSRQGLPGDMVPGAIDPITNLDHTDVGMGLAFHSDSPFQRGMRGSIRTPGIEALINGAVIPARSENDTSNNPHNPMYAIQRTGADGEILGLIGTENSDSGGNSMAPAMLINPEFRPTKIDRPSDVTGLVDTGQLVGILGPDDATAVMESIYRLSDNKMNNVTTQLTNDAIVKDLVKCGYLKAADVADRFGGVPLDPLLDPLIAGGPNAPFTQAELEGNGRDAREFRKTASVMKLVIDGYAGAGCIEMGGYDYHGGARAEGEVKDERAGRCMGACLQYAANRGVPLMMYVFSDGSLSSNGTIDNSVEGRGKGEWSSDNQSTAGAFFLVYNPTRRATLFSGDALPPERHQQIGYMRDNGSVETGSTPAANNVNLLVETVALNYMALHGEQGQFDAIFPGNGLNGTALKDSLTAFDPIVSGTISNPT